MEGGIPAITNNRNKFLFLDGVWPFTFVKNLSKSYNWIWKSLNPRPAGGQLSECFNVLYLIFEVTWLLYVLDISSLSLCCITPVRLSWLTVAPGPCRPQCPGPPCPGQPSHVDCEETHVVLHMKLRLTDPAPQPHQCCSPNSAQTKHGGHWLD